MVILGDSALCWDGDGTDRWLQNWYKEKKFSTLSIRGNHDNPDLIAKLPLNLVMVVWFIPYLPMYVTPPLVKFIH